MTEFPESCIFSCHCGFQNMTLNVQATVTYSLWVEPRMFIYALYLQNLLMLNPSQRTWGILLSSSLTVKCRDRRKICDNCALFSLSYFKGCRRWKTWQFHPTLELVFSLIGDFVFCESVYVNMQTYVCTGIWRPEVNPKLPFPRKYSLCFGDIVAGAQTRFGTCKPSRFAWEPRSYLFAPY